MTSQQLIKIPEKRSFRREYATIILALSLSLSLAELFTAMQSWVNTARVLCKYSQSSGGCCSMWYKHNTHLQEHQDHLHHLQSTSAWPDGSSFCSTNKHHWWLWMVMWCVYLSDFRRSQKVVSTVLNQSIWDKGNNKIYVVLMWPS